MANLPNSDTSAEFPANPFWDFSLKLYSGDGVAPVCLALQERHGVDVNVLLFACWFGVTGQGALTSRSMQQVLEAVSPWHDCLVRELRALRVGLKEDKLGAPSTLGEALRGQIKSSELYAERIEQSILYSLAEKLDAVSGSSPQHAAEHNLVGYFEAMGWPVDAQDQVNFEILLSAAIKLSE